MQPWSQLSASALLACFQKYYQIISLNTNIKFLKMELLIYNEELGSRCHHNIALPCLYFHTFLIGHHLITLPISVFISEVSLHYTAEFLHICFYLDTGITAYWQWEWVMFIFNYSSLYIILIIVLNIRSADVQGTYTYFLNTITFILETNLCIYESNLLLQACIIVFVVPLFGIKSLSVYNPRCNAVYSIGTPIATMSV